MSGVKLAATSSDVLHRSKEIDVARTNVGEGTNMTHQGILALRPTSSGLTLRELMGGVEEVNSKGPGAASCDALLLRGWMLRGHRGV